MMLIGPTGSGKSPLGHYAEQTGFHGRRCVHFDFGRELRNAASATPPPGLADNDIAFIRRVLSEGALLEDDSFTIAETILREFITVRTTTPGDLLILNGLPRHLGQMHRLDPWLQIILAIHLRCSPEIVFDRIRLNSGGDRTGRVDDSPDAIRRKLALFEQRTAPLLDECRHRGIPVITLDIPLHADPSTLWAAAIAR